MEAVIAGVRYHSLLNEYEREKLPSCNIPRNYATVLSSLWQIGADYLSWCPRNGQAYLEAFFDKVSIDNEHKAMKLMSACAKYQLDNVATSVARQMTVKLLAAGRISIALGWCLQAKVFQFSLI